MRDVFTIAFMVGLVLLSVANLSMRLKSAPPVGSGPFMWPWQMRDRFTSRGYIINLAGVFLWVISAIANAIIQFSN